MCYVTLKSPTRRAEPARAAAQRFAIRSKFAPAPDAPNRNLVAGTGNSQPGRLVKLGNVKAMSSSRRASEDHAHPLDTGPLAGIRRLSARETVRARIALAVEIGVLEPGERLPNSDAVATALQVSEGTVRRALTSLCENGVLDRRRGRTGGTFVAEQPARGAVESVAAYTHDAGTVRRLIDHRILLECGAAHLAASRAEQDDLGELHRLVAAMDTAESWAEFHELDARFHREISIHSGLENAREELATVLTQLHQYFLPYRLDTLRESNGEHRDLVEAIATGNPARAAEIAQGHVAALKTTMFIGMDH